MVEWKLANSRVVETRGDSRAAVSGKPRRAVSPSPSRRVPEGSGKAADRFSYRYRTNMSFFPFRRSLSIDKRRILTPDPAFSR